MPAGHGWPAILAGLPADAGAGWLAGAGAGAGHMAGHMACHIRAKLEPSWGQVGAKLEPSWEAQEAPTSNFWQFLAVCKKFELCWVKKASKTIGFYSVFLIFHFLANLKIKKTQ